MSAAPGDPPAGYRLVGMQAGVRLLLPDQVANRLRRERDESNNQQARERDAFRSDPVASVRVRPRDDQAKRKRYRKQPKAGWYRVLPAIRDIERELDGSRARLGHSDEDLAERLKRAREALVALGPDRRLVRPATWRTLLHELESELPHFRGPLEAVRRALALGEATGRAVRVPPMLLLGPPGLGKTYFCHRLAEVLGVQSGVVGFDQPSFGGQLRGSDSAWANTQTGLLFNLLGLGDCANPLIVLDELDKAHGGTSRHDADPLAQLHAALEPQTARRIEDVSVHVELDASMVTYVATANSLARIGAPLLSRFEVFAVEAPQPRECVGLARAVVGRTLARLGLEGRVVFEPRACLTLAHMSPRRMVRAVEGAIADAVLEGREQVEDEHVWRAQAAWRGGPLLQ